MRTDPDLDAAGPFLHQAIDPNLEEFVVSERPVGHDDTVVELVVRSPSLARPVVVAQLDEGAFALVETNLVVGKHGGRTAGCGRGHSAAAASRGGGAALGQAAHCRDVCISYVVVRAVAAN